MVILAKGSDTFPDLIAVEQAYLQIIRVISAMNMSTCSSIMKRSALCIDIFQEERIGTEYFDPPPDIRGCLVQGLWPDFITREKTRLLQWWTGLLMHGE